MQADCQLGGVDIGVPDVCKSPAAPLPWPNFAFGPTAIPSQGKVLYKCTPAHNMATVIPFSVGDSAGIGLGVRRPFVMGFSRKTKPVKKVVLAGSPATRVTCPTNQNGGNGKGMRTILSQPNIILL
ncbi:hypothetical protein QFZ42_004836 [Variovorax paradoxus]|jgi:hypothetical protein|uniref:DUF4150 domain-containing protein n=1 Tax=Variovorax paradoxus TaxID=34073 RepID=UPI002794D823|nr:DUF4150 domain-containing protein [Variovorax paradoxus]MDQ0573002.1 hypothetical protein [Variovorax paradoxus]